MTQTQTQAQPQIFVERNASNRMPRYFEQVDVVDVRTEHLALVPSTARDDLMNALAKGQYPKAIDQMFRHECMWFRFNFLSDALERLAHVDEMAHITQDNAFCWALVNRLLNLPINQYDFNAYGEIHSMGAFKAALELCTSSSVEGAWKIRTCSHCYKKFSLEYRTVMELQLRNADLPRLCPKCGGQAYVDRAMKRAARDVYNTFKPMQLIS